MLDMGRVVRDSVATVRSHKNLRNCRIVCRDEDQVQLESQPLLGILDARAGAPKSRFGWLKQKRKPAMA